eukprot:5590178-Prymnesium_polylepis.2
MIVEHRLLVFPAVLRKGPRSDLAVSSDLGDIVDCSDRVAMVGVGVGRSGHAHAPRASPLAYGVRTFW